MKFAVIGFIVFSLLPAIALAQTQSSTSQSGSQIAPDSTTRALDSAYRARKAELDAWVKSEQSTAHPQEDFLSAYMEYGGYVQILPKDLNVFFSQRVLDQNPQSNQNNYSIVDRSFLFGGQAQLASNWGIYFEYDLTMKWFNITVDSVAPKPYNIVNADEDLDLTEHSFVVGGMYIFYSGPFYRVRASGGIGGVIALTDETEMPGGYDRSASAAGYQINFDLLNDFRVAQGVSFTIDFLTRTVTTGPLKTSGGQTLDAAFGAGNPHNVTIQPTASSFSYGAAAGLVFYF